MAPLRRKDEGAFREVELARNLLHLAVRQPIGFRQHGELVARKWALSEDVAQEKRIRARHPSSARIRRSRLRDRSLDTIRKTQISSRSPASFEPELDTEPNVDPPCNTIKGYGHGRVPQPL